MQFFEGLKKGAPKTLAEIQRYLDAAAQPAHARDIAPRVPLWLPAFTRRREIFVGRIAMVGFFAACFWEATIPTHPGILAQVSGFTGLDQAAVATLFLVIATHNVLAGLAPWSPTFDVKNQRDVEQRPIGPPRLWYNPFKEPRKFFGVTPWGFTKANELFHGRLAMLGFAAALINEVRFHGLGPLAQLAYIFNWNMDSGTYYDGVAKFFWAFCVFAIAKAWLNGKPGSGKGDEDIY